MDDRPLTGEIPWVVGFALSLALEFLNYVVLAVLGVVAVVVIVIAWFAILFAASHPRSLFDYVMGIGRWALCVQAYAFLLVTDRYPPFSLS
jgi:hypothetical protein